METCRDSIPPPWRCACHPFPKAIYEAPHRVCSTSVWVSQSGQRIPTLLRCLQMFSLSPLVASTRNWGSPEHVFAWTCGRSCLSDRHSGHGNVVHEGAHSLASEGFFWIGFFSMSSHFRSWAAVIFVSRMSCIFLCKSRWTAERAGVFVLHVEHSS